MLLLVMQYSITEINFYLMLIPFKVWQVLWFINIYYFYEFNSLSDTRRIEENDIQQ